MIHPSVGSVPDQLPGNQCRVRGVNEPPATEYGSEDQVWVCTVAITFCCERSWRSILKFVLIDVCQNPKLTVQHIQSDSLAALTKHHPDCRNFYSAVFLGSQIKTGLLQHI